jgi:ADP-heptose:LPS heptosyltransferase
MFFRPTQLGKCVASGKVLVVKSGGLGDFLFGVPAFNLLKNSRQEFDIDLLTYVSFFGSHSKDMAKKKVTGLPWVSLVEDLFGSVYVLDSLRVGSILELRKKLKPIQYSNVILMPCSGEPFSTTIKKLILIKVLGLRGCEVYGVEQDYSTAFFRKYHEQWGLARHKIYGPWHAVEEFLSKNIEISDSYLEVQLEKTGTGHNYNAIDLLRKYDLTFDRYILISPGSIGEWKNWGLKKFKELVVKLTPLLKERNIAILIAGPLSDSVLADELKIDDNVFDICGRYSIFELAIIHKESICSVAVDGGAAHLAAFSGAHVISLSNGGEEPGIVTPVGSKVIEHRNLTDCTPCFGMTFCPLGHSKCVQEIKVNNVFKSIMSLVETSR